MDRNTLRQLQRDQIEQGELPLVELLENSFYYPASGFDGAAIKHFGRETNSFFYCDYSIDQEQLVEQLDSFFGDTLIGARPLRMEELVPNGWTPQIPPGTTSNQYHRNIEEIRSPFAHWAVYGRQEGYGDDHGPGRFSLIFIGGEGVASYQALYWSNRMTAKWLGIVQPGTGFGGNWTDFRSSDAPLAWVVLNNPSGVPDFIVYGGHGQGYQEFSWPSYSFERHIQPYYSKPVGGQVSIWKREKNLDNGFMGKV